MAGEEVKDICSCCLKDAHCCIPVSHIVQLDNYHTRPGYEYRFHTYQKEVEIVYVTQGAAYVTIDAHCICIRQHDCLVIFPGVEHDFYLKRNESCTITDFVYTPVEAANEPDDKHWHDACETRYLAELRAHKQKWFRFPDVYGVGNTLQSMLYNWKSSLQCKENILRLDFCALCLKLSEALNRIYGDRPIFRNSFVQTACEYILNHYNGDLRLENAAKAAKISERQLSRLFFKEVGMTVQEYIHFIKINKARELLRQSDLDITEIAFSLGFNSSDYFTTFFKRLEGVSPKAYRQL